MNLKVLDFIRKRKATFFLGAGISMIPPSCLPSWWQINHTILDALTDESVSLVPEVRELTRLIKKREDDGKLPPEFVAEIITDRIGESYFDVLQALEGDTPNQAHLWLAKLAKAGLLTAIVTTNFDTLIERAFEIVGASLRVFVHLEDYENMDLPEELSTSTKETPCMLLKLHGTATQPNTCIDTLAQRKRGLHPTILNALNLVGSRTFWIILGYSGADLEANSNYLGIRARMNNSPGFTWLHLPDREPLSVVAELADLYGGERGMIEFGILPGWLSDLEDVLPPQISSPEAAVLSSEEIEQIKTETTRSISQHASDWAKARGTAECVITLSDIAIRAGCHDEARSVLLNLLNEINEVEMTSFGLGIVYQELGDIAMHIGENKEALTYYQQSTTHFRDVKHMEGVFHSLQGATKIQTSFGHYAEAEKNLKEYLEYTRSTNDSEAYIHALIDIGSFYREIGKLQNGLEVMQEALPLAIQQGLEILRAHILLGISMIEMELGNPVDAERHATEASNVYSRLGNDSFLSETLRHLAQIHWKRGDVQYAFELLEQAKTKANLAGNKSRMVRAEQVRGEFLVQLGNYSDGETILRKVAKVAESYGNVNLLIVVWQNLGLALQMQGKLEESYTVYKNALTKSEMLELDVQSAGLRNNLGILSEQLGHHKDALENYQAADEVFKRTGQLESIANSKGNIANIHYRLENFEESKNYYRNALDIFEKLQDIGGILRTRYNLANVIYQSGDIQQAKEQYERAISMAEEYSQPALRDYFQLNYANVLFQLEDYPTALELYIKTYASSIGRKDYSQAGMASYYAGLAYLRMNQLQKAIEAVEQAISVWGVLEEEPPMMADAREFLKSLKQ